MGCNCGQGPSNAKTTYTVTEPSGTQRSYSTEVEAKAAALRTGGTYKAVTG